MEINTGRRDVWTDERQAMVSMIIEYGLLLGSLDWMYEFMLLEEQNNTLKAAESRMHGRG